MKRRLFNLAAAMSLVLCIATATLWVRSAIVADQWVWRNASDSRSSFSLKSDRGGVAAWQRRESIRIPSAPDFEWTRHAPRGYLEAISNGRFRRVGSKWQLLGFGFLGNVEISSFILVTSGSAVFVPYWAPVLITALAPLLCLCSRAGRRRIMARRRERRCLSCGYDIRAIPDRCPECGAGGRAHGSESGMMAPRLQPRHALLLARHPSGARRVKHDLVDFTDNATDASTPFRLGEPDVHPSSSLGVRAHLAHRDPRVDRELLLRFTGVRDSTRGIGRPNRHPRVQRPFDLGSGDRQTSNEHLQGRGT